MIIYVNMYKTPPAPAHIQESKTKKQNHFFKNLLSYLTN